MPGPSFFPATLLPKSNSSCIGKSHGQSSLRRGWPSTSVFLITLCCFLVTSTARAQLRQTRRVLILNDLVIVASPGFAEVDQAVLSGLQKSPYQIELYHESLQLISFPSEVSRRRFREEFLLKYSERKPDLIVAAGTASLKFVSDMQDSFIRDTPVIFCTVLGEVPDQLKSTMHFTGVLGQVRPAETLDAALRLLPGTEHVVVVGGMGAFDEQFEAATKRAFQGYESKFEVTYLTDLTMPALLDRLRRLPSNSIIYHTAFTQDAVGERFIDSTQALPLILGAANAPVFVMDDVDLREGAVGGDLVNWANDGYLAADMAVRVLNGEKPENIPIVRSNNAYMFDWRALKRWGLRESDLPLGSIVLNRQPGFWYLYKRYLIGGIFLFLVQALVIAALLWQRARRRQTEAELVRYGDRLRMAMESGKSVGWESDFVSERRTWFGDLRIIGISSELYHAKAEEFYDYVHPDDRQRVSQAIEAAKQNHTLFSEEFRLVPKDQSTHWLVSRGKFLYGKNGEAKRMIGLATDITEVKEIQKQLGESEERFRRVANTAPVMIWMSNPDKLRNYFNQPWLDFTSRPIEAELGSGWAEGVHPEDRDSYLRTYTDAFDRRESFKMEYRLRRHDAEYRWVFDLGVPRFNSDGSFAGYIGSCIDITERKLAEAALAGMGRKLMEAHEQERTRIARELHDDINQRIAVLSTTLEGIGESLPNLAVEDAGTRIREASEWLAEIGADIQGISHRLHSSKLEYLGIVMAASSFCKELSAQQKIEIDFRHANIPPNLPKEVSLCLFRVLQEALQNAVKYSGVRHFTAELRGTPDDIHMIVGDCGIGFDKDQAMAHQGLGLISMRERVQMVNGDFEVESEPGQGTTIHVRIPLQETQSRIAAAG